MHPAASPSCLSLWERWHGEAVTERVFRRYAADAATIPHRPSNGYFCNRDEVALRDHLITRCAGASPRGEATAAAANAAASSRFADEEYIPDFLRRR